VCFLTKRPFRFPGDKEQGQRPELLLVFGSSSSGGRYCLLQGSPYAAVRYRNQPKHAIAVTCHGTLWQQLGSERELSYPRHNAWSSKPRIVLDKCGPSRKSDNAIVSTSISKASHTSLLHTSRSSLRILQALSATYKVKLTKSNRLVAKTTCSGCCRTQGNAWRQYTI
jgi:hypothetical protein